MGNCCMGPESCIGDEVSEGRIIDDELLPKAVLCPPGSCVLGEDWSLSQLRQRFWVTHDTMVLTFGLADAGKPLGLSTCACVLARFASEAVGPVVRPFTPISTNAMVGEFQLLVKVYEDGVMSRHLDSLPIGGKLEFKHGAANVKVQYPFHKKHVMMLAGGTGITPMLQALHAILGTPGDTTSVTLIFSNKREDDIIGRDILDTWSSVYAERFRVVYVLTRAGDDGARPSGRGHIGREFLEKHAAPPSGDTLVMVCGPPSLYDSLCGPRGDPEVAGVLRDMGYAAEQVIKF